jgi:predicted lipoprotein
MTVWRRAGALRAVLWVAVAAGLALVRPWTIRPLHLEAPVGFDAASFARSAWPRVQDEAARQATDVIAADGGSGKARFVKGSGVVIAIDRGSRVGIVRVAVPGLAVPVALQVGPVIRGTAIRDASSFIQFSDFTNQSDYAAAANALNDYSLRAVIAPLALETLHGRAIAFIGAVGRSAPGDRGAGEVVPLRIDTVEAVTR